MSHPFRMLPREKAVARMDNGLGLPAATGRHWGTLLNQAHGLGDEHAPAVGQGQFAVQGRNAGSVHIVAQPGGGTVEATSGRMPIMENSDMQTPSVPANMRPMRRPR